MGDEEVRELIEAWLKARGWTQRDTGAWLNLRYLGQDGTGCKGNRDYAISFQQDRDLLDFIRAWNEAQWVKIEPGCKMPEDGEIVIIVRCDGIVREARYRVTYWVVTGLCIDTDKVRYWRPMPAAPKEGER